MKNLPTIAIVMLALLLTAGGAEALGRCGQGNGREQGAGRGAGMCWTQLANLPLEDLNDFEKASLLHMREEEKLARDVYLALGAKYDLPVFTNIPRSEQRHMDRMADLLERYGLEDPVLVDERGKFRNPELQQLHIALVYRKLARGSRDHLQAFTARLAARGESYQAHHIAQADLEATLATGQEHGPADGQQMARRGQGRGGCWN